MEEVELKVKVFLHLREREGKKRSKRPLIS